MTPLALAGRLRAVLLAASTDDTRGMYGVLIERRDGWVRAVATDGHRMHVCQLHAEDGSTHGVVIPPARAEYVCDRLKAIDKASAVVLDAVLDVTDSVVRVSNGPELVETIALDHRSAKDFPSYVQVFPDAIGPEKVESVLALNPRYLADFQRAVGLADDTGDKASEKRDRAVEMHFDDWNPILLACPRVPHLAGIVMPCRNKGPRDVYVHARNVWGKQ